MQVILPLAFRISFLIILRYLMENRKIPYLILLPSLFNSKVRTQPEVRIEQWIFFRTQPSLATLLK